MGYDYGNRARGRSYEYYNFYESMKSMGHTVELFDYMEEMGRLGKIDMNAALVSFTKNWKPDVAVFSLYTDQLDLTSIQTVRQYTKTLCFFHDDTWRREFSKFWAPHFDYFTSSDFECQRKYQRIGLDHILHFPFGVNEKLYRPMDIERKYDVSFVGGWHPYREWIIKKLKRANIQVKVAGHKWPAGILPHEEMVRLFNESRINLNLSNSKSWDARYLASSPMGLIKQLRTQKDVEQIKARHFEINACRSFQLSYYVEGLERCYRIGEELAVYIDPDDLVEKVLYYLADDKLRENIAEAGYQRTLAEHTYAKRFQRVFSQMELNATTFGEQKLA
jgi:spore maturation protein CgeB